MRKRGSETAESIAKRLKHAQEDSKIAEEIKFDLIIVNADLKESFEKLKDFLKEVCYCLLLASGSLTVLFNFRMLTNFTDLKIACY